VPGGVLGGHGCDGQAEAAADRPADGDAGDVSPEH